MKLKTITHSLVTFVTLLAFACSSIQAAVTGRNADSSIAGTEKLLSDSSGTDTYITVSTLLTGMALAGGLTASGSTAYDFSGSTGGFKSSTGANVFGGSSHTFASSITPATNDVGALGSSSLGWSDLFLASGGVINMANGNWVATHSSGVLTVGTGDVRVTTAGTNGASVVTNQGAQTLSNKTLTAPVIAGATASGSTAINLSGNSGTFSTPTGTNVIGGNLTTTGTIIQTSANSAALVTGPNGSTNPVFKTVNNVSSAATGLSITGRAAGAGADLTVLSSGTNESLAIDAKGSGTITLNGTGTGNIVLGRATTTSFPITITSASATAFTVGANGTTNPVFSVVDNISSVATGLSITGRAAAAGVDLAVLSSGTNESLKIDAKGSGTVLVNNTATGAFLVADATNPAFSVVHTTEGTGLKVTSAAAASGVALAAISSGTNESVTFDAKGSGTILLNGTATGAVNVGDNTTPALSVVHTTEGTGVSITSAAAASGVAVAAISSGTNENLTLDAKGSGTVTINGTGTGSVRVGTGLLSKDLTEVVTATNVITAAESGSVFFLNSATEFVSTLPAPAAGLHFTFIVTAAPSGASYTIVTNSSANIIVGNQNSVAGDAGDFGTADDTISFVDSQSVAGDKVEVFCDGTNWFAYGISKVAAGLTFTQAN